MEDKRPYWKAVLSLIFSLISTTLVIVLGMKLFRLFLPFVIGWIISLVANPMVCWLEKHLKIVKKWGSALTIVAVIGVVMGLIYLIISKIAQETISFVVNLPQIYQNMELEFDEVAEKFEVVLKIFPQEFKEGWNNIGSNLGNAIGEWIGKLGEPTVIIAGNIAKSIPSILIATIITILSAYFFVADRDEVIIWTKQRMPKTFQTRIEMIVSYFKYAIGGYFKAQFQIMLVLTTILFVGFMILGIHYAILLALLFAFLDFLPFFGTAVTLVPWAIYKAFCGDYKIAIGLLILYVLTQLTRQLIQPKLVSNEVGMKPLPTLALLYLGYKIGSVWGMIFAVPIGIIVIKMYEVGAFDYILKDIRKLLQGIAKLRE